MEMIVVLGVEVVVVVGAILVLLLGVAALVSVVCAGC